MRKALSSFMARFGIVLAMLVPLAAQAANYSDIWWNPDESGWGVTIADHDTNLFVVFYTYRPDGRPVWYTVPGGTFTAGRTFFQGDVYVTRGPSYGEAVFDSRRVVATKVGTALIDFAAFGPNSNEAIFAFSIDGTGNGVETQRQTRIQRQSFGTAAPAWGNDYTDLWFNPGESGWGLSLAQHGNNVFGVWYTYDYDGEPIWVVMPGVTFTSATSFRGKLYTTTGPYFGRYPFDPSLVSLTEVGEGSVSVSTEKAALCQGVTAVWEPVINRAPLGTIRQQRLSCPQPFGAPNNLAGAQPPAPSSPKTCTGTYSASVAVPGSCTSGAGSQRSFSGRIAIGGIDWSRAGHQDGTLQVGGFLASIDSSVLVLDGGRIVNKPCDIDGYTDFADATVALDMSTDAAGTVVGTGSIDIGIPWQSALDLRVPGGISVNGHFSYRYDYAGDSYVGSGSFACQIAR